MWISYQTTWKKETLFSKAVSLELYDIQTSLATKGGYCESGQNARRKNISFLVFEKIELAKWSANLKNQHYTSQFPFHGDIIPPLQRLPAPASSLRAAEVPASASEPQNLRASEARV